jgi:DNA-binding protein HU-beta
MNKYELINAVEKALGDDLPHRVAADAVDAVFSTIVRSVVKGEAVTVTGFGVFEKRRRAARVARNPRTGEKVKVRAVTVPHFRASVRFKDSVAKRVKLGRTGSAISRTTAVTPTKKTAPVKKVAAKKVPVKKAALKGRR